MDRRLVLVWAFVPLAFIAYACSSNDSGTNPEEPDSGGSTSSSGSTTSSSGATTSSSSSGGTGDASDDGEAGPTGCPGNPLSADGGSPDGGVIVSLDAGANLRLVATSTGSLVDGPVYTDVFNGGSLIYSEVYGGLTGRIVRIGPDGGTPQEVRIAPVGTGGPQFVIGNAMKGNVLLTTSTIDPNVPAGQAGKILQTFADGGAGTNLGIGAAKDPNDLVVTKGGVVFFTDPGYQSVTTAGNDDVGLYRIDGTTASLVKAYSTSAGDRPDGIALSPDEKTLYVGFGDQQRIDRFTLQPDGGATFLNGTFASATDFGATLRPEGLATDEGGNVWVAASPADENTNGGTVVVFSPAGKKYGEIRFPNHRPVGVAFGGDATNKALYIVANAAKGGGSYDGEVFIYPSRCAGVR